MARLMSSFWAAVVDTTFVGDPLVTLGTGIPFCVKIAATIGVFSQAGHEAPGAEQAATCEALAANASACDGPPGPVSWNCPLTKASASPGAAALVFVDAPDGGVTGDGPDVL